MKRFQKIIILGKKHVFFYNVVIMTLIMRKKTCQFFKGTVNTEDTGTEIT